MVLEVVEPPDGAFSKRSTALLFVLHDNAYYRLSRFDFVLENVVYDILERDDEKRFL